MVSCVARVLNVAWWDQIFSGTGELDDWLEAHWGVGAADPADAAAIARRRNEFAVNTATTFESMLQPWFAVTGATTYSLVLGVLRWIEGGMTGLGAAAFSLVAPKQVPGGPADPATRGEQ